MDATKPYEFIGLGAMDATKPYEFIGLGAMDVTKPYEFIRVGASSSAPLPPPPRGVSTVSQADTSVAVAGTAGLGKKGHPEKTRNSGRYIRLHTLYVSACAAVFDLGRMVALHLDFEYMVFGPAGDRRFLGSGRPRRPHKPFQRLGGEAPHLLEWFFGAAGAAETPKIKDYRPAFKPCIKNPSVNYEAGSPPRGNLMCGTKPL